MRAGSCKYGVACKFNHPQPATAGAAFPLAGSSAYGYSSSVAPTSAPHVITGISPWPLSRVSYMSSQHMQALPAYVPLVLPPTQGTMPGQQGWSTFMVSTYFKTETKLFKLAKCSYYYSSSTITFNTYISSALICKV